MQPIRFGKTQVSRFILGSNPFSGFSHQGEDLDMAMRRYYTIARIKATIRQAETLGINTLCARTDHHVMRMLLEYWDEGGGIQWFAQTCPEAGDYKSCVNHAASGGAKACHIHGGVMDFLLAQGRLDEVPALVDSIRQKGLLAGIAGHNPRVFEWAEERALAVDYYMCSYYNPLPRDKNAKYVAGLDECYLAEDRAAMTAVIGKLSKPVIHYKIMAAGRNDPAEAFAYAARQMRPCDAVCVGVYTAKSGGMLKTNVDLLERALTDCLGQPSSQEDV